MKNRKLGRFMAALLCSAMVITSGGINVDAAQTDLTEETNIAMEATDSDEIEVDVAQDEERVAVSANAVSEDIVSVSEDKAEEELLSEEEDSDQEFLGSAVEASDFLSVSMTGVLIYAPSYSDIPAGTSTIAIPKDCTTIPSDFFKGKKNFTTVYFEDLRTQPLTIEAGAFSDTSIQAFYAPTGYTEIKEGVFRDCDKLKTVDLANSVTKIGDHAFDGCTSLTEDGITGCGKVDNIGSYAFKNTGFTKLDIAQIFRGEPLTLGSYAFSSCTKLTTLVVPASVTSVPSHCFEKETSLTSITVRNKATVIGSYAFYGCTKLEKIEKSKFNAAEIGANAFSDCSALKSVILPESVKKIGSKAFEGCSSVTDVELYYKDEYTADNIEIAEDAFPSPIPSQATMKGYDGKVKTYAESSAHKFKSYVSLIGKKLIKQSKEFNECYEVTTSFKNDKGKAAAAPGTKVRITVKTRPERYKDNDDGTQTKLEPARLVRDSLYDKNGNITEFKFVSGKLESQVFEFVMGYGDVILDTDPLCYTDHGEVDCATLTHSIGAYEGGTQQYVWSGEQKKYIAGKPGYKGQIKIDATTKKGKTTKLGCWMFEYTSSDSSVVSVSNTGVITGLKNGEATITCKYRGPVNTSTKLKVFIGTETKIAKLDLEPVDATAPYTVVYETRTINKVVYNNVPVVRFSKAVMDKSNNDLNIKLLAKEEGLDESFYVDASWISGNTDMATLAKASGNDNANKVTLKKGVIGETYVRAAYKVNKDKTLYAYLILRVEDISPRLSYVNLTTNTCKDEGGKVTLIPYKGYAIDSNSITLKRGKTAAKAVAFTALKVVKTADMSGAYKLTLNYNKNNTDMVKPAAGESVVFTGDDLIFVSGRYILGGGKFEYFDVPFNKMTIINDPLKFSPKTSGTINLFYNYTCYDPLAVPGHEKEVPRKDDEKDDAYKKRYIKATVGEFKVTNNIEKSTAEVDHAELWCKEKYDKYQKDEAFTGTDKFNRNFTVAKADNGKDLVIRRSSYNLATEVVKGKDEPVTSGYLAVFFKGYTKPSFKAVTVSTKSSAPDYGLSVTSTKENSQNVGAKFKFKIINKSTKKPVISQGESLTGIGFTSNGGAFESVTMSGEDVTLTANSDYLIGKKTAKIKVQRKNWYKTATYSYKVTFENKTPTAKLTSASVTINNAYPESTVETKLNLNHPNATLSIVGGAGGFTRTKGNATEAAKIKFTISAGDNSGQKKIGVGFVSGQIPKKGTYKFKFTPSYTCGGVSGNLKSATITVKVISSAPTVKLSKKTYTFNTSNIGKGKVEKPDTEVTLGNLPKGVKVESANIIDVSNAVVVSAAKKSAAVDTKIIQGIKIEKVYYDAKAKKLHAVLSMDQSKVAGQEFNRPFYINNIKVNGSKIKDNSLKVTFKGVMNKPTVSVKTSGTINTIDYTSEVKCVRKFKNLNSPEVSEIQVITSKGNVSGELKAVQDEKKADTVHLKAIHPGEQEFSNTDHSIKLRYKLSNGETVDSPLMNIRPNQKTPTLETSKGKLTFNQGAGEPYRSKTVTLTKTSQLKTHIIGLKLSDSNEAEIKQAFDVFYDDLEVASAPGVTGYHDYEGLTADRLDAGVITLKCKYPELLVKGKTYEVKIDTLYDGQFLKRDEWGTLVKDKDGNFIPTGGRVVTIKVVVNP